MFYLTEDLITAAKRSEFFPVGQVTFTDPDDLIAYANEEMQTKIVPFILTNRQDFFLASQTAPLVSLVNHYGLPERAIGNALKDLFYVPDTTAPGTRYPIPRADIHDFQDWASGGASPAVFSFQGDEVVVAPTPCNPSSLAALMFFYFLRPGKLVPTTSCAKITAVNTAAGTTTLTLNTDLTASLSVGSLVDFLAGKSPFRLRALDVAITAITATTIAVAATAVQNEGSVTTAAVGDYICPAQQANIPMIPQEFHPILSEMICARALKALGFTDKLQACQANIKDMLVGAYKLIENRAEAEPEVLYDHNGILNSMGNSTFSFVFR